MLPLAILGLASASVWSVIKAPESLRTIAAVLFLLPASLGGIVTHSLTTDPSAKAYYGIAGAIGGWMVGALIYDNRRKKLLAAERAGQKT
jgi:peptidoglycan/LPS O-acetylase OafA/YrhL